MGLTIIASFVIVLSNSALSYGQLNANQDTNPTNAGVQGWTKYTDVFHGFTVSHPSDWIPRNDSITDGNFTLVTRFDRGAPQQEPFLNFGFFDLSNRHNVTLDGFAQEQIDRIKHPLVVGGQVLSESKLVESTQALLANKTAYQVTWEEQSASDTGDSGDISRKMSIWTIVGDKAWEITFVAPSRESYSKLLPVAQAMIDSFELLPQLDLSATNQVYANAEMEYKIRFPSNWTHEEDGTTVFLHPPQFSSTGNALVSITYNKFPLATDIETYSTVNLESLQGQRDVDIQSQGFTSLSGYPAWYVIYDDISTGLVSLQVSGLKGSSNYIITYVADSNTFDTYLPIIRAEIDSFQIGTPEELANSAMEELSGLLGLSNSNTTSPNSDLTSGDDKDIGSSDSSPSAPSDTHSSTRCPDGYHRSPSGNCEVVTDTRGMPRCPDGYHRSPDGDCERVR